MVDKDSDEDIWEVCNDDDMNVEIRAGKNHMMMDLSDT